MYTYKVICSNKRKIKSLIYFLQHRKSFCYYIDEGRLGHYVRVIGKDKQLETFLKKLKLNYSKNKYYPFCSDEGEMVSKHFDFFQETFGYFFKMKLHKSKFKDMEFLDRIVHIFVQTNAALKLGALHKQEYESLILSQMALGRARYLGILETNKS